MTLTDAESLPDRVADHAARLAQIARVGQRSGVATMVIRDPATLGWLLEARVHVPQTLDTACLDVLVDPDTRSMTIVTNVIEAPRLMDTELADLPAEWEVVPWWESRDERIARLLDGGSVGSDRPVQGLPTTEIGGGLADLRRVLTLRQQHLLADVGRTAAAATTSAAQRISPSTTEYAAAAALAAELIERGLDPIVLFAAGDRRIGPHRHPLPTNRPLGVRAMLVCCARRHGLVASVTRIVCFGPPAGRAAYLDLLEVERVFLDRTLPGARLGDIVAAGTQAYADQGFSPDEWHRHHQGGLSGVLPREFPAALSSELKLKRGQVVAWNPSGHGWKVEDTGILGADGLRLLVDDGHWPTVAVGGRRRPDLLLR